MSTTTTKTVTYRETVDFERLDNLIAWAEREHEKSLAGLPSEWDQSRWVTSTGCGTACCIAGRVALEDGVLDSSLPYHMDRIVPWVKYPELTLGLPVANYAQAVLGLPGRILGEWNNETLEYDPAGDLRDSGEPPRLFSGTNELWDLKRIRDEYAVAEGVPTRYTP